MSDVPVLELRGVRRSFTQAGATLDVLRGAACAVRAGELVALVGPSGAGKSTLLHIAGLLEHADGGAILVRGEDAAALDDGRRTELRRRAIGFVYQFHHLLPELSARDNVALPQQIAGKAIAEARRHAEALLADLGLAERSHHQPAQLSGGEQQRVAIARALANSPRLILADEPTGNLDPATSLAVFDNLFEIVRRSGAAALIATHNLDLAERMDRVLTLRDGHVAPWAGRG